MTHPPHGTPEQEPLSDLLRRLRRPIQEILWSFRLDEAAAEEVLEKILLMLVYRWDRIANREVWLLATLKRFCWKHHHGHGQQF
ncbi:MAG TPA: hypothetical protein VMM92_06850 [Thermoanaerobaculia bacterium]|nr:hypothetical protein [Thermoanaerobaculia bacterium]